jgi:transcriptional regulator with XRE-family HTH domain
MDALPPGILDRRTTGDLIKRARHADEPTHRKHVSQAELARRIGVSSATVELWETGCSTPRLGHLEAMAKALDVPVSDVISDEAPAHFVRDPAVLSLIAMFETLTPQQRDTVLATIGAFCAYNSR